MPGIRNAEKTERSVSTFNQPCIPHQTKMIPLLMGYLIHEVHIASIEVIAGVKFDRLSPEQ